MAGADLGGWTGRLYTLSDRFLLAGVLGLLVLSVPPFGAAEPEARAAVFVMASVLGLVLLAQATIGRKRFSEQRSRHSHSMGISRLMAVMSLAVVVYGLLLTVSVPGGWRGVISPETLRLQRQAGEALGAGDASGPLSLDPFRSTQAVGLLAAYIIFFFVCLEGWRAWRDIRLAAAVFVAAVLAVSVLGIIQQMAGEGRILWAAAAGKDRQPFGPFINRNHFAAWANLGAMTGLGYFLSLVHLGSGGWVSRPGEGKFSPLDRPAGSHAKAKIIVAGLGVATIAAAVFLSLSRGGMVGFAAGAVFLGFLLAARSGIGRVRRLAGMLLLVFLILVWLGLGPVVERLGTLLNPEDAIRPRINLNRDLLRMVADFPLTGTGPGTFASLYPLYQTADGAARYKFAHNDYLQLAVEWGLIGAALVVVAAALFWWRFLGTWSRRRAPEVVFLSAGAAAGLVSVMVHSLVDFSLHLPAVALAVTFTAALAAKSGRAVTRPGGEAQRRAWSPPPADNQPMRKDS